MLKTEEKQNVKVVELTERKNKSLWKSKDKGMILMSEMEPDYLQAALITVQNRQMRSLDILMLDLRLETELKQAAKEREIELQDYDVITKNGYSKKYSTNKELIRLLGGYIKKKVNEMKKEKI